jgi:uncharacterized protein (TIGR02284 family)
MAQDIDKLIEKLNDLIALDIDAVNAYDAAIKRIEATDVRDQLRTFQQDHERHIRDLSGCVVDLHGKPRQKADAKGFFLKSFTAITSMMGDKAALTAMKGNEQLTNRGYDKALEENNWPPSITHRDRAQPRRRAQAAHLHRGPARCRETPGRAQALAPC